MLINALIISLLTVATVTSSSTVASDNPFKSVPDNKQKQSDKKNNVKIYPYGYTSTELASVPTIRILGHKNPELIDEHEAWAFLFRFYIGIYQDDPDDMWYIMQKRVPSLTKTKMSPFILLAQQALEEQTSIKIDLKDDKFTMCEDIINAAESGEKLANNQIIKRLDEQKQKLPIHLKKVKENLEKEFSPQVMKELASYVNTSVRSGMTKNRINIAGWAKLRGHNFTYSDLYEGILCRDLMR